MAEESFAQYPGAYLYPEDNDLVDSIASLEVIDSQNGESSEISIYPGQEVRVGRGISCRHIIPDDRVSKQHFRIYSIIYEAGRTDLPQLVYCEDLESSNGTYVNEALTGIIGQERRGFLLTDGDIIEIRPFWKFKFHQSIQKKGFKSFEELGDLEYFSNRFQVSDRILGEGAHGVVYVAQEVATSKQVACKIVNLNASSEKYMERRSQVNPGEMWHDQVRRVAEGRKVTMREIKILSKLSHPHIINLKKAFCTATSLYMVTELAPGGDLFSYLESYGGHLDDWHGRVVSRQLALAIEYLHSKGIAHRDIKPENVLLAHTDYGGRVILTDFGFANISDVRTGRLQSVVGTAGFVAPEIQSNEDQKHGYTLAADLWSLGVLTACLLTGNSLIPKDELSQLSQLDIANRFLGFADSYTRNQWVEMAPRAQRFLRNLLTTNPINRMTAKEALNHSWYKKPHAEATLLEDRYHKIIRFWKARDKEDEVIEYLPSWNKTPQAEQERQGPKFRRKIPDATLSPYFSLDRHILQRGPTTRKTLLASLQESGSPFMPSEDSQNKATASKSQRKKRDGGSLLVDARDMFGASNIIDLSSLEEEDEVEDEVMLVPTEPMPHIESLNIKSHGKPPEIPDSQAETDDGDIDLDEGRESKRTRRESWDPEDRRIHDLVSSRLPRFVTAKTFRDTVQMRKANDRKENMKPSLSAF